MIIGTDTQLPLFGGSAFGESEQPIFLFRIHNLTNKRYEFWKVQNNNEEQAYEELEGYLRNKTITLVTTTILWKTRNHS